MERGQEQPQPPTDAALPERLAAHVRALSHEIGNRDMFDWPRLERAAAYVTAQLTHADYAVQRQEYDLGDRRPANLIATLAGDGARQELIVVGAHYDSCGNPGADDNASGVAGLLELARVLRAERLPRTVELVAFVNEEPPFFQTSQMGSWHYVQQAVSRKRPIQAALILEMIGYYSIQPRSQRYPPLFGLFYPNRGEYLGIVSSLRHLPLARRIAHSFRRGSPLPAHWVAAPSFVSGVDWSDQWAFWRAGYPAVMLTDTAFLRNPHYHAPTDTWDTLDYPRMAQVVEGLHTAIVELAAQP